MFGVLSEALKERENERYHRRLILETVTGLPFTMSESDMSIDDVDDTDDDDLDGDIVDDANVSDDELNALDRELDDAISKLGVNATTFTNADLEAIANLMSSGSSIVSEESPLSLETQILASLAPISTTGEEVTKQSNVE